jgi:hypothetical protein
MMKVHSSANTVRLSSRKAECLIVTYFCMQRNTNAAIAINDFPKRKTFRDTPFVTSQDLKIDLSAINVKRLSLDLITSSDTNDDIMNDVYPNLLSSFLFPFPFFFSFYFILS